MKILLATSNPHKLDEVRGVWLQESAKGELVIDLVSLEDAGLAIAEPVEDRETFEGNAVLKARYYAQAAGRYCLADDSGLEVDALNGEPGVRSARYAQVVGPRGEVDQANNRLLLDKLCDVPADQRGARFVCAMALCAPGVSNLQPLGVVRGVVEGRIIGPGEEQRGENGFGYDPLFLLPDLGKTTAQISAEHKNAISHRGKAARLMWSVLQGLTETQQIR